MQRAFAARWTWIALAIVGFGSVAGPAHAIEFWDERIQIHGFYESRLSFGYEDFNAKNKIDMYGWLQVLNIEVESEIAPDGWGPFDMVAAYSRVEVKFDCVWSHACGTLPSVDAFGEDAGNLPTRVQTGRRLGLTGSQLTGDTRPYWFADRQRLSGGLYADDSAGQRASKSFVYGSTNVGLFGASAGPDGILGPFTDIRHENGGLGLQNNTDPTTMLPGDDDAGLYLFNRTAHCNVGNWTQKASNAAGFSNRELIWGIDNCPIDAIGFNREVANPFRDFATYGSAGDANPVLLAINLDPTSTGYGQPLEGPGADGIPNATALPFRPGSETQASPKNRPVGENWQSQGMFVPNLKVREALHAKKFDGYDQNYSIDELQWNRGGSQQATKELREAYVEVEAFESRLWVRAGQQTIVWGKTELFRNQDQFNPVDIAIGPLASLEEARIALWALRGIWSFYEVGPLEDVRLELATILDDFEPTDVGRCGEPYVPRLACTKSYGLWIHGENGTGVAGEVRPDDPWEDSSGIEVGARIEFRWDRFSFALTDYWGYADVPYTSLLFQYSRNVDPMTGRPRKTESTGPCVGGTTAEPDCLVPGMVGPKPGTIDDGVIANHSINQSLFAWVCAGTVGVAPAVDASACAFTLFNSTNLINPSIPVPFATAFSAMIGGGFQGKGLYNLIDGDTPNNVAIAPVLNATYGAMGTNTLDTPATPLVRTGGETLSTSFSVQQQALYGCGPFYSTVCDVQGVDLGNGEASVMLQSFPWFEGTYFDSSWDTADASLPQPGTVDALLQGYGADITGKKNLRKHHIKPGDVTTGAVGTRYEDDNGVDDDGDGRKKDLLIIPGAHVDASVVGPIVANMQAMGITIDPYVLTNLAGWDPVIDGTTGGRRHPFTGQLWASKTAIASWNFLMLASALGAANGTVNRGTLDRQQPLALGRCSFRQPQYCSFVSGLAAQARNTNSNVEAGGNGKFGRRNYVWASVGDLALQYEKRNIIGFSTDFAEDTTKSSWGVEFTHVNDALNATASTYSGLTEIDEFNLTLSVDRPTFINFLNANRTFFINAQLFSSYLGGYDKGVYRDGPWTALFLINANTGYFQDRFLVSSAVVWDFTSNSGAYLPSVQYRFTENFSLTIGAAVLAGRWAPRENGINQFSATSDSNLNDTVYVENGISPVRDLDNFFLRLRYTY